MASRDLVIEGKFTVTNPDNIEREDESSVSTKPTVYDTDTGKMLEYVPYKDVKKLLEDAITEEEEMEDVKNSMKVFSEILTITSTERTEIAQRN